RTLRLCLSGLACYDYGTMPQKRETIESFKYWADYLKHLTTLSTGSILLITTFLEKLFEHPQWKCAAVISLCGFLSAVMCAVLCFSWMAIASHKWDQDGPHCETTRKWDVVSLYVAWIGFLVGMIFLTIFAIRNLIEK